MNLAKYFFATLLFLTACTITGNTIINTVEENNSETLQVYFCEKENCENVLVKLVNQSDTVSCAFYSLNSENIKNTLKEKNARVVIETDNNKDFEGIKKIHQDKREGLMHNKFCIFDDFTVITGSWNPADKTKTANNMLVVHSKHLAQNYQDEFEEMWYNIFGGGASVEYPQIKLNGKLLENYFCPEDDCQQKVLNEIKSANSTINFMTYSFTDDKIGDALLEKSKKIFVKGIFDSSQLNEWSEQDRLKKISVVKKGVHHKVFVIDGRTVITGSYNPTKNGNEENDENLLIIHDEKIAQKFLKEFDSLFT